MPAPLPANRLNEIKTRYAAQVHIFPAAGTFAIFLNTQLPPFDKLAARQAFNYAIDRRKAVTCFDAVDVAPGLAGADGTTVTCQIVPAGMTGYRPYCPYTRNPTRNGSWTAPDLARARTTRRVLGDKGKTVVFTTGPLPIARATGKLAVTTLKALGYIPIAASRRADDPAVLRHRRRLAQPGTSRLLRLVTGLPRPIGLSHAALHLPRIPTRNPTHSNLSEICDPRIDKAIAHARSLQTSDRQEASNAAWATADDVVTDLAPWVPLANTRNVVVVSRRVHNVQSNQQWGVLIDQISVR